MNKGLYGLFVVACVLIACALVYVARPDAALPDRPEPAKTTKVDESPIIKTASQSPMTLPIRSGVISPVQRCVNLGGAMEAPREGDWGYTIRRKDIALIKRAGFDTIRLPVKWSAHTQTRAPYTIDPAVLARTDEVIGLALQQNLKVILDVHHYDELMENPKRHIPRLTAMWEQLASHYAGYSDGLIFELLNEPNAKLTITEMNQLNPHLLKTVRRTNPNRWVVAGSGNWNSLEGMTPGRPEAFVPPNDPRLITTFHYYDDMNFTHQGAQWFKPFIPMGQTFGSDADKQSIAKDMAIGAAFGQRAGTPVLLGEFGVLDKVPASQRAAWTRHVRQQAEANNIGWCYWEWGTSFKLYDTDTETFVPGLKDALFQ